MQIKLSDTKSRFTHLTSALFTALLLVGCSADEGPAGLAGGTTILTIGQFAATPDTVAPGGSTTLSYTSNGAASCTASSNAPGSSWMGPQPTSGNFTITVPQTPGDYTYTLTCASATGEQTSQTETVTVPAPAGTPPDISGLTAMPASVAPGGTTQLSYTTTGAVSCVANSSAPGSTWTGSQPTSSTATAVVVPTTPGSYTYALTCTNAEGQQSTEFVTVTVTGGGGNGDEVTGGGEGGDIENGNTPTDVTDGPGGAALPGNFFCTRGARFYGPTPSTDVTVNGLVGDAALGGLLDMLGGGSLTQLLASVSGKELAVDSNLDTFAQFNLTAGLFGAAPIPVPGGSGNLVSSVDLLVGLNSQVPIGEFVVFGLSFPEATVEASIMQTVTISTFLGETAAEIRTVDLNILDLVGMSQLDGDAVFAGFKNTLPYDKASISLNPALISANVGNAMNVHELCTGGRFITAP